MDSAMAYNPQLQHLPPKGRYYSSKGPGPQPAPRPTLPPQPHSAPPPQQQFDGNYRGRVQSPQDYGRNYQHGYGNNGFDGYGGNEYSGYANAGYENHRNGSYDGHEGNDYNQYGNGYYRGYEDEAYNNQAQQGGYGRTNANGGYGGMNGQYQQFPQQRPLHQQDSQLNGREPGYTNGASQRPGYGRSQSDGPHDRGKQPQPKVQQRSREQQRDPRERSRTRKLVTDQTSLDTLAWDNPFPSFPTKKKPGTDDVGAVEEKMAKASLEPARHSEDLPRPSFASLNRPRPSLDGPERPRIHPYDPRAPNRPSPNYGGPGSAPGATDARGQLLHDNGFSSRRSPPDRNQPPPISTQLGARSRQQNHNPSYPEPQEFNSAVEPLVRNPMDRSMITQEALPRPQQARVPEHGQATSYHGPDSPSYSPRGYQNFSHPNGISNQQARRPSDQAQPPVPEHAHGGHSRQDTIEDVYNGYYEDRSSGAKNPPFRDREAEIEAEMPNFDDPTGERPRPKAPSDPAPPALLPNKGRPGPDFYHQARAQRSQPDLRSQSAAEQRQNRNAMSPDSMPERGFGGAGSPPYQQNGNVYSRPAYAALAQNRSPAPPQVATGPSALPPRQAYTPQGRSLQSPVSPPQPSLNRNHTFQSQHSDPGPGYGHSPTEKHLYARPATSQAGRPPLDQQPSNPDALPEHPTPAQQPRPSGRPGLPHNLTGLPQNRPTPVRQYDRINTAVPTATTQISPQTPSTRTSTDRRRSIPITPQELDRLRAAAKANPSDQKLRLHFAKKLVEAAAILSDEGGRADTRTRDKNRERYINDAHKEVKKLASQGYPDAQFYLADCYGQGALGLQVDTKEAFTLYQAAAKAGHAGSAYRTAVCCEMGPEDGGGTRKDPMKAVQWYKRAASLGDVPAMYKMGMILLKGLLGQPANLGEALIWLQRAADRADVDNPHALHELGLLYESQIAGQDKVIRDERYAFELFSRAAALRYKFSQFRLGQAYEYGLLTCPIDARQSIQWYTKAAAQAEHQSELALSGWYLTGSPGILEQSDTEAYLWARKAATADPVPLPKAMFAMGYFTEVGIGCPRSLEEAKRWYGRAAAYKFPKAQERLEELRKGGPKVQKNRERLSRSNKERNDAECAIM